MKNGIDNNLKMLVIQEVESLKKILPVETRKKLNFETLDTHLWSSCIYGQMFGYGCNQEACEVKDTITVPYSSSARFLESPSITAFCPEKHEHYSDLSPMEFYISLSGANIRVVVEYLREERETIRTQDL